jgi:hypothetical protein
MEVKTPTPRESGGALAREEWEFDSGLLAFGNLQGHRWWIDTDPAFVAAVAFVFHNTIDLGEDREIASQAYIAPRMDSGAELPHEDVAGLNRFTGINFYSATLPWTIPSVAS